MATPATVLTHGHTGQATHAIDGEVADPHAPADCLDPLSRTLLGGDGLERSVGKTLRIIVAAVLAELPRVTRAGVTLVHHDGTVASRAPSDASVVTLDGLQSTLEEGPRHDCLRLARPVTSDDLTVTGCERWPRFAPAALGHQVHALCAVPIFGRGATIAAVLNLYASAPGAFDTSGVRAASLIASQASLALHAAHRLAGLNEALASRDVIGQAKGVLIERYGLSDQQAFDRLVRSSQDTNIKLRDVATWLVNDARGHHSSAPDDSIQPPASSATSGASGSSAPPGSPSCCRPPGPPKPTTST